jgi:hypothetical protein
MALVSIQPLTEISTRRCDQRRDGSWIGWSRLNKVSECIVNTRTLTIEGNSVSSSRVVPALQSQRASEINLEYNGLHHIKCKKKKKAKK